MVHVREECSHTLHKTIDLTLIINSIDTTLVKEWNKMMITPSHNHHNDTIKNITR